MNQLPNKTTLDLIEKIERGEIDTAQAGQQIAKFTIGKRDNLTPILIGGLLSMGLTYVASGGLIIPILIGVIIFDKITNDRENLKRSYDEVNRGEFLKYLPESEREIFSNEIEKEKQSILKSAEVKPTNINLPSFSNPGGNISAPSFSSVTEEFTKYVPKDYKKEFWDVIDSENSFFVAATKGRGKGVAVSNIIRSKLDKYPNSICIMFDPKDDEKENGYWDHPRINRVSFKGANATKKEWMDKADEFIKMAIHLSDQVDIRRGKRLFVIFEEFLNTKNNLEKTAFDPIKTFCSNAISMGDSEGIHVLISTQSFNARDSVDNDELLKNLCLVGIFKRIDIDRAKKLVKYGKTVSDDFSEANFNSMINESPVNRVLSLGGKFMPCPELENYSGYNRDTNESEVIEVSKTPGVNPNPEDIKAVGMWFVETIKVIVNDYPEYADEAKKIKAGHDKILKVDPSSLENQRDALGYALSKLYPMKSEFLRLSEGRYEDVYDWATEAVLV